MKRIFFIIALLFISFEGYSQTYSKRAKGYFENGCDKITRINYTGAVEDFSMAIQLDPGFKQAYENRGVAKFFLQDNSGAIEDYTKALEIDPYDFSTYGRRGWSKFYLHDYAGAIADLDIAVSGSRDKYRYYNFRGQVKYRLKDFQGAIADFNTVIMTWSSGKEQRSSALYWRGVIQIISGQIESGCRDLRKAVKSGSIEAEIAIKEYCSN